MSWNPTTSLYRGWLATRRNTWLRRRRLASFSLSTNAHLIEIGCGDGLNLKVLTDMGMTHLTGFDRSILAIKQAKKLLPHVSFRVGDAWKLPYGDKSFDVVLVDSVLHMFSLSPQPLMHMKRVLRPKGYLCFIEPHASIVRTLLDEATLSKLSQYIPYLRDRRKVYIVEKQLIDRWFRIENEFVEKLVHAGWRKIFYRRDILSSVGKFQKLS